MRILEEYCFILCISVKNINKIYLYIKLIKTNFNKTTKLSFYCNFIVNNVKLNLTVILHLYFCGITDVCSNTRYRKMSEKLIEVNSLERKIFLHLTIQFQEFSLQIQIDFALDIMHTYAHLRIYARSGQ